MIGRCDHDHVAGQLVELHEKERDNALDLARFMDVATLLADGVELVEKEHTRHRPCIFEQAGKPSIGLAEIGTDQRVVSDGEQGNGHGFSDRFGQRRLPVSGRAREQDAMPRLHSLRAKQIRPALLLDQLARQLFGRQGQDQIADACLGFGLDDEIAAASRGPLKFA